MRKEEILFDAITNIRENLVEDAQNYAFPRRVRWQRWAGLAACLALAAFLSLPILLPSGGSDSTSSGGDSNGAASMDQAAPEAPELLPEESGPPPIQAPAGGPAENTLIVFNATVTEVREKTLLVEPDQGSGISAQAVVVPTGDLPGLPALKAGDRVTVTAAGPVMESEPAQLAGVTDVALLAE